MKGIAASTLLGAASVLLLSDPAAALPPPSIHLKDPNKKRDVDTRFPYTGPDIPIGDWVDPTVNGNGKGFPRLVEAPAVKPSSSNPTNNVNVISLSYLPGGINIHFQTPFGLGVSPSVKWGTSEGSLTNVATGASQTYNRTPPCSAFAAVTQCSQFFHDVQITGLESDTTYYYMIPAANGTTASQTLSFTTSRAAGDAKPFSVAVLNDMGYTNAGGTWNQLKNNLDEVSFFWHGGDISYADDWYSGILPCDLTGPDAWPVCYNGTSTQLPGGGPIPAEYEVPLPAGEEPNQGGPQGGDMSVIYESNWDLWQQWINPLTTALPYMVLPGNHEATCAEFDGPNNELTAYLAEDKANATSPTSNLTYYSCPPSQRNFTAYQNRFRMPGAESKGVSNFWYSFDYGLAHFISLDGETDFANSPEYPFARDSGGGATEDSTYITDSGPFGEVDGSYSVNANYQQIKWLQADLAAVDRTKTPWVIAMSHRPMYSSGVSSYQKYVKAAFEPLLLQYGVDVYLSGHIHWYERLYPIGNGTIDTKSVLNNHTYLANPGVSMTHIINGMAGNIESHSTLYSDESILNITAVLDTTNYGFSKLTVIDANTLTFNFIEGSDGGVGDSVTILKKVPTCAGPSKKN